MILYSMLTVFVYIAYIVPILEGNRIFIIKHLTWKKATQWLVWVVYW